MNVSKFTPSLLTCHSYDFIPFSSVAVTSKSTVSPNTLPYSSADVFILPILGPLPSATSPKFNIVNVLNLDALSYMLFSSIFKD